MVAYIFVVSYEFVSCTKYMRTARDILLIFVNTGCLLCSKLFIIDYNDELDYYIILFNV